MKKIEDYLHLYLGCECKIADYTERYWIRMINETRLSICVDINSKGIPIWYKSKVCRPILRPLSNMTEEEKMDLSWRNASPFMEDWIKNDQMGIKPSEFLYLLSKQFDLFNLIEEGLAIDATKINQ